MFLVWLLWRLLAFSLVWFFSFRVINIHFDIPVLHEHNLLVKFELRVKSGSILLFSMNLNTLQLKLMLRVALGLFVDLNLSLGLGWILVPFKASQVAGLQIKFDFLIWLTLDPLLGDLFCSQKGAPFHYIISVRMRDENPNKLFLTPFKRWFMSILNNLCNFYPISIICLTTCYFD